MSALVGFGLILAIALALLLILGLCAAATAGDEQHRAEFAPLYRDDAGHEAWVREGLTDFEPGETPTFEQLCFERWEAES